MPLTTIFNPEGHLMVTQVVSTPLGDDITPRLLEYAKNVLSDKKNVGLSVPICIFSEWFQLLTEKKAIFTKHGTFHLLYTHFCPEAKIVLVQVAEVLTHSLKIGRAHKSVK